MIELKLKKSKKKLYFNLKNYTREKSFRDAWYSMSDMSSCENRKLKVTTDKNKHYTYKVNEIESVQFIDREYLYEDDPSGDYNNIADDDPLPENTLQSTYTNKEFICGTEIPDCILNSGILDRPSNIYNSEDDSEYSFLFGPVPSLPLLSGFTPPPDIKMPPCLEALRDGKLKYEELPDCAKKNIEKAKGALSNIYDSLPKSLKDKLMSFYTELIKQKDDVNFNDPELLSTVLRMVIDNSKNTLKYVQEYIDKKKQQEGF